jgi:hypothetical protein
MLVMLLLANGCSDSKPGARRAASEANLEQVLRQGLEQPDPFVRAEVIDLISSTGVISWTDRAKAALADSDPLVGMVAARALLASEAAEDGIRHLDDRVLSGTPALSLASMRIAFSSLPYSKAKEIVNKGLRSSTAEVRREAIRLMLDFIRLGKTPDASTARALEQQLLTFLTDTDPYVVALVLEYTGSEGRLAEVDEATRGALYELAKTGELEQQRRALRILTAATDGQMKSFLFDLYRDAEGKPERSELFDLALVGMGQSGDKLHIPELERIAGRETDPELQKAALTALFAIDDIDASLALSQVLEGRGKQTRLHILAMELRRPRNLRLADVLLKDDDPEVRLAALKVMHKQDSQKFQRTVSQKLAVEQYRRPILTSLCEWMDESPAEKQPWLGGLASSLRSMAAEFLARDDLGGLMAQLIIRLDGVSSLTEELSSLSSSAQYVVLRALLAAPETSPELFKPYATSPFYFVQLAALLGLNKRSKG